MITKLNKNQVFVFGSNLNGEHLGGAAKLAYEKFGAEWGVEEGLKGDSYAFPTLDFEMKKVSKNSLEKSRDRLFDVCQIMSHKEFLLTKVGCGIAGFSEKEIKPLFKSHPGNLILPKEWKDDR